MNEDLVHTLYAASYRRLVGQLYGICGDLAEAEDVVQETFVRALGHRRALADADNAEAWLRRVAVNLARTRWRRRALGVLRSRTSVARDRDAVEDLALPEDRIAVVAAVRKLPPRQRDAIALHYLADLPLHEVAATLDAPLGTVKAWLHRGRAALAAAPELGGSLPSGPTAPTARRVPSNASQPTAGGHRA